jgi:Bardet-Biedl syndrome 7 protein
MSLSSASGDMTLGRLDICLTASQHKNCSFILPTSKNKRQKLILADDSGTIQSLQLKKHTPEVIFKVQPNRREISAITHCNKDKLYLSQGQNILCLFKKKGNQLGNYSTTLNEDIQNLLIDQTTGVAMHVATSYSYNSYSITKNLEKVHDEQFWQSGEKINAMRLINWNSQLQSAVLGLQDKYIKIIHESNTLLEQRVEGAVSSLINFDPDYNTKNAGNSKQLIYATDNGFIGHLFIESDAIRPGFSLSNALGNNRKSGVNCLATVDFTQSGQNNLVVGRDDGLIEIFSLSRSDSGEVQAELEPIWSRELNESIVSLDSGYIINTNSPDLLISTFSGKVLTFSSEIKGSIQVTATLSATETAKNKGKVTVNQANNARSSESETNLATIRSEIEALKQKVEREKEKLMRNLQNFSAPEASAASSTKSSGILNKSSRSGSGADNFPVELIATEPQFKVKHSFTLLPAEQCYLLAVEIGHPLDTITLQSNIGLLMLDTQQNTAILSRIGPENKESKENNALPQQNELLAVFKFNPNDSSQSINRVEVKLRTVEGEFGQLTVCIMPKLTPRSAQFLTIPIKPLSLHEKVATLPETRPERVLNTLNLTGNFSLSEIHTWLGLCLPDFPPRAVSENSSAQYSSILTGSALYLEYSKGQLAARSDSPSTIAVLKDILTREATNKKINISPLVQFNPNSVDYYANLLRTFIDFHLSLARKIQILPALQELQTHEGNIEFLSAEYKEMLLSAEELQRKNAINPQYISFCRNLCVSFYNDTRKLQGKFVGNTEKEKEKIKKLVESIENNYSFDRFLATFKELL